MRAFLFPANEPTEGNDRGSYSLIHFHIPPRSSLRGHIRPFVGWLATFLANLNHLIPNVGLQKKKGEKKPRHPTCVRAYTTFKQIELESRCCSGF